MTTQSKSTVETLYYEETLRGEQAAYHLRWALIAIGCFFIFTLMWFSPICRPALKVDLFILTAIIVYNIWLRTRLTQNKNLTCIKYISVTLDICAAYGIGLANAFISKSPVVNQTTTTFIIPILLVFAALRYDKKLITYATVLSVICFNAVYYIYYPYMDDTIINRLADTKPLPHVFKSVLLFFFGITLLTFYNTMNRLLKKQKDLFDSKHESEEQYRLIAENASDVIWVLDLNTLRFKYISPSVENTRGYTPEEAMQLSLEQTITPDTLKPALNVLVEELNHDTSNNNVDFKRTKTIEVEHFCKDGTTIWSELKTKFIRDNNGNPVAILGASRDITDRKRAEKQMLQSEKMAALGNMVAGVAHEISTPLGVALLSASYLMDTTQTYINTISDGIITKSEFNKYTNDANEASTLIVTNLTRAADLLNSFKQVAVDQVDENQRVFNVKSTINQILASLHPEIKRTRHTISFNCPDQINIKSNPGAFSQIITNLVMNSLIHGFCEIEKGNIIIDISIEKEILILNYKDDGAGMDKNGLKKIFDPFFTTKRNQGGTGIGMHIVYSIVVQTMKGEIDCTSQIGKGLSYVIKIPIPKENISSPVT